MDFDFKAALAKRRRWQIHPEEFVHECLRIHLVNPDYKITVQQMEALRAVGQLSLAKRKQYEIDHGRRPEDCGFQPMTEQQAEYAKKYGVSIMSGRGIGKSAFDAWLIIWFLMCFDNALVVCTATKQDQLKEVIWGAVSQWRNARLPNGEHAFAFRDLIKVTGEHISYTDKDVGGRSANMAICQKNSNVADQQATLGGNHSENMIILGDEASGIPDPVFEPLERTMTQANNFAILTFNPLKNTGYAYDTHYDPKISKMWVPIHWSAEDSELVTPQAIQSAKDNYGEDSDKYRVNILGLPPTSGDGVLIPFSWVTEAADREKEPDPLCGRVLGVDPARHGENETVLLLRQGSCILDVQRYNKLDGVEVANAVIEYVCDHDVKACFIDTVGVGGPIFDMLKRSKIGCRWYSVEASKSARGKVDGNDFRRLRDELWWRCRQWFATAAPSIPNDKVLIDQLTDVQYTDDSGKIVVESKASMKKKTGSSPDLADALNLTFFVDDRHFAQPLSEQDRVWSSWEDSSDRGAALDWMGA